MLIDLTKMEVTNKIMVRRNLWKYQNQVLAKCNPFNNEIENDGTTHGSPCNENLESIVIIGENMKVQIKGAESQRNNNSSEITEIVLWKIKSFIEYHIKEKDPWKDALVMRKTCQSLAKYRYWLNVKDLYRIFALFWFWKYIE